MAPKSKEQVEKIRQKSTEQILASALELFARNGFHNTTMRAIAAQAGVSKGLIYNYFDSKDDLLQQIIENALETGDVFVENHQVDYARPVESIDKAIDDIFHLVEQNPDYWKLIMALSMKEDIVSRFRNQIEKHGVRNLNHIKTMLKALQVPDPRMEAMFLAALFDGIMLHYIYSTDEYPLEEVKSHLKKRIHALVPIKSSKKDPVV